MIRNVLCVGLSGRHQLLYLRIVKELGLYHFPSKWDCFLDYLGASLLYELLDICINPPRPWPRGVNKKFTSVFLITLFYYGLKYRNEEFVTARSKIMRVGLLPLRRDGCAQWGVGRSWTQMQLFRTTNVGLAFLVRDDKGNILRIASKLMEYSLSL